MPFTLKKRKYGLKDLFLIPYKCAPVATSFVALQKLVAALTNIFQVIATAQVIDRALFYVQYGTGFNQLIMWLTLMLALVSWKRVSWNVGSIFTHNVQIKANNQIYTAFVNKRAKLDYSLIEDDETNELISRISTDIEKNIWEMLQRFLNLFFVYIPRIVGILIIIYTQIWWLALAVGLLVAPLILVSMRGGKKVYKANQDAAVFDRRHRYLSDLLTGRETVEERSIFGYSPKLNDEWYAQYEKSRKINLKAETIYELSSGGGSIVTSIISSVIVVIMIPLVARGQISIGMFIALTTAVYDLVGIMSWQMTRAVSQIAKYTDMMKDYTKFAALPEVCDVLDLPAKPIPFKSLQFKNISFKYPKTDRYILKNFNMTIESGKNYSFVGENGCGKTTITKLMLGLYTCYEGEILLNGKSLKEFSPSQIKANFAGVYQDFARYFVSVHDNIRLGNANCDDKDIIKKMKEVAATLDIDTVINNLPQGYDTVLGKLDDDGTDLSFGQWQRLAMARLLVSDAPLFILDEPTAALDPINESLLYQQFGKISKGRTTIFISHRLGSTKLADHIFVLKNGSVVEQGAHDGLMRQDGIYAQMYLSQQSWYSDE